ncbi:MAG: STAS domain-containing protein [Treponema sp.]|nr:STAS domain-containing protein [Treponema sp.]
MNIEQKMIGKSALELALNGRLDAASAPLLEDKLKQQEGITELILDFKGVDYISSMCLRAMLHAKKTMKAEGISLCIKNMKDSVREIFEMTGFLKLMEDEE